ncbi:MAG TPA: CotS family spore coat protein [Bacillota bacterium]|nr:CotS family spore coat protein [Bacillota bacterium]HPT87183.1 CotS family spore coat protein [Bacillota bacterium]
MSTIQAVIHPPDQFEVLRKVTESYGLKLYQAENCRKVWKIETSEGTKYLKQSKLAPADLQFIYEVLEYLHVKGFRTAPRLWLGQAGEPFANGPDGIYILTDWFDGNELDFNNFNDLADACRYLAEFHRYGQGFEPAFPNQRTAWYSWPAKWERRIRELNDFRRLALAEKETSVFSRLYLRHFEPFYRQAIRSYERLLQSFYPFVASEGYQQKSLCHHDYSSRNILRNSQGQLALIDFDYCLRDIRIHDIMNLLLRNLRHQEWSIDVCRFILRKYHQVSKLSADEMEVMYVLLSWPEDFWQVGLQYYYEKLPWPTQRFVRKLEHRIEWRFLREKFLSEFPSGNGVFHWKESVLSC